MYEKRGWWAQYKKNGTCTTITLDPAGDLKFMTRHAEKHKAWQCPPWLGAFLLNIMPAKCWTMLVAELLHSKTPTIKDTLFIHDVIVYKSTHLIDSSFAQRQIILDGILPTAEATEHYSHWEIAAGVWRAKNLKSGFVEAFDNIKNPRIDEGLVVKDPAGKLKWCIKEDANKSWQAKARYPTKNYQF